MKKEIKHYKVKVLPTLLNADSVYYVKASLEDTVKTYITDQTGTAFPLIDLGGIGLVNSVTGTGVTGIPSDPIINISTFRSTELGNLIQLSTADGKLFVKPIISPDESINIIDTLSALEITIDPTLLSKINNGLQPGDNISELVNDEGYITDVIASLGYTPEDSTNKSTSISESASTTKFPVWSAIVSYFDVTKILSILGVTTLSGDNTGDQDLSGLVVKNTAITGATKTKITYDAKGLVTAGADATTADVTDSTDKRYQTDNQQLYNDATSSIQTQIDNINTNATDKLTVKLSENISKGQAVYISTANGTNIIVSKASNSSEATSSKTLGLLETTGVTNDIVNVITNGALAGLDTSTSTIGDAVWLGTSGNLIFGLVAKPVAPSHLVYIGVVSRVSATVGEIFVNVQNGFEMNEIHDFSDVSYTTPIDTDSLMVRDVTTSLWKRLTFENLKANLLSYFNSISQITITATGTITTDTTDVNGIKQSGRNVLLQNGIAPLTVQCVTTSDANFNASYWKGGSTNILFAAGAGVTLFQSDGTATLSGAKGSTAVLTRETGTNNFYVRISNV